MRRRELIAAAIGSAALGMNGQPEVGTKCPYHGCEEKFGEGELLCDWMHEGKVLKVHARHILDKHLRKPNFAKK